MQEAFTYRELRLQDTKNRQNPTQVQDTQLEMDWGLWQKKVIETSQTSI